jgi:Tol biopolymer transport system component/tRNA A-37 threonylcarbamoyl transferase component Bud32
MTGRASLPALWPSGSPDGIFELPPPSRSTVPDLPPRLAKALADRYTLDHELGEGGMATVYLAEDLRHHRKVAIKVLRPELAAVIGAERFLKEIETTASLQHPHILPLLDSGESDGFLYYVMPFVEGESLRDRLTREKQLPLEDAVRIAREVAGALDYAHRHDVIHRDIKPENILLHDGSALVADFGIALAASKAGNTRMTETGMSLGTPHYMSPEQAMGEREITARSDVYALGCITYEMLTGEPPFTGATAQAIVARVLTESPRSLTSQRRTIPGDIEGAVLTALEKLPADRWGSAAEFAEALEGKAPRRYDGQATTTKPAALRPSARQAVPVAVAVIATVLAAWGWLRPVPGEVPRVQAALPPPPDCRYSPVFIGAPQLSPDGSRLAFMASCGSGRLLWLRHLASGRLERLEGTEGATFPFWSPDGASLGFFADGQLKRIDLHSMAVRNLAPAPAGRGGSWSSKGTVLFAPDIYSPIMRVDAGGGTADTVTGLPDSASRVTHRNPHFLPDGEHFLFNQGGGGAGTVFGRLGDRAPGRKFEVQSSVAYADGRLLYVRDGVLVSQPFDPGSGKLSGTITSLVPRVEFYGPRMLGVFTVAGGTLVYQEPAVWRSRVIWFDPATRREETILPEGDYWSVSLAPDRERMLVARGTAEAGSYGLWLFDLQGGNWARVGSEKGQEYHLGWFPDGSRFFYADDNSRLPERVVSWKSGAVVDSMVRRAYQAPIMVLPPDASYGLGRRQEEATGFDITRTDLRGGDRTPVPFIATPADEHALAISPDGRLLAYLSNRSSRDELLVTPLPGAGVEYQVSLDGSRGEAAWAPDGRALYFIDLSGRLMVSDVTRGEPVRFGKPRPVASAPENLSMVQAASDGRLVLQVQSGAGAQSLTVVTGWQGLGEAEQGER